MARAPFPPCRFFRILILAFMFFSSFQRPFPPFLRPLCLSELSFLSDGAVHHGTGACGALFYSLKFSIRKVACALTKPVASIHSLRSSYPQRPSPCPCFFVLYGLSRLPRYRFHPHLSALSSLPIVACASPWTPCPPCHMCLWRQSWRDALWTANSESKPTLHGFMPWVGRKASAGLPNQRNGSSTKLLALVPNTGAVVVRMVAKTNSTVLIVSESE